MTPDYTLPGAWQWASFGDIATVASNLVDPAAYGELPHIAPNHIESRTGRLLPHATVGNDGVTSPKHLFHRGQILYSKIRPYLAKVVEAPFDGLCSADMYPIETMLIPRFLLYWLLTPEFTHYASHVQGRTVLPKINRDQLEALPVPVAPLREQERIVAAIEEQLSRIDVGATALERVLKNLKRIRADVLDQAFIGVAADQWQYLSDIGYVVTGNTPDTKNAANYGAGLAFVTPSDFDHGAVITRVPRALTEIGAKVARPVPSGSVLVTCIGATLGKVALTTLDCATNQQVNAVVPGPRIVSKYLFYCLARPAFTATMWREASSTTMPILNKSRFSALRLPIISVEDQLEVVKRLDERLAIIDNLAREVRDARTRSDHLRSSILKAAFAGRLVPQNPEDEPASTLLERVAAQRLARRKRRKPNATQQAKVTI